MAPPSPAPAGRSRLLHPRVTRERGESRLPVLVAALGAAALQYALPDQVTRAVPRWLAPLATLALVVPLLVAGSTRLTRESRDLRLLGLGVLACLAAGDAVQLVQLVMALLGYGGGAAHLTGAVLIRAALQVWGTSVVVFALAYYELDRGGPRERLLHDHAACGPHPHPDLLFPQQAQDPATPWLPGFADYFFVSFTAQTAFSPTDTLPLTARAKMVMMVQSLLSLVTVAVVAARAVNVLPG